MGVTSVLFSQDLLIVSTRDWSHYFLEIRPIILTMATKKDKKNATLNPVLFVYVRRNLGKIQKEKPYFQSTGFFILGFIWKGGVRRGVGTSLLLFLSWTISSFSKNSNLFSLVGIPYIPPDWHSIPQKSIYSYNSWSILPDNRWLLWNSDLDFNVGASIPDTQV